MEKFQVYAERHGRKIVRRLTNVEMHEINAQEQMRFSLRYAYFSSAFVG